MAVKAWETPIVAAGRRSLELTSVSYESSGIVVRIMEESERRWRIRFRSVQGLRITTFESAFDVLKGITLEGALFECEHGAWLSSLGLGHREYMEMSHHFIICCYDEVVEVAAWSSFVEEDA